MNTGAIGIIMYKTEVILKSSPLNTHNLYFLPCMQEIYSLKLCASCKNNEASENTCTSDNLLCFSSSVYETDWIHLGGEER